jgi:hypothetical protein
MSAPDDLLRLIIVLAEAAGATPGEMRARLVGMPLDELTALIARLPANVKTGLSNLPSLAALLGPGTWTPSPGPQTMAYESLADVLGYGGEPGGGKSQLLLGLAFTRHRRSFIMRRQYADLSALIEDALKIHGSRDGFNASPPPRLRIDAERTIHFRAAHLVGDEQGTMGQARDLLGIDEATQFAESQIRFLMGWVRSEDPNQRTRTVLATNPPLAPEGLWFVKMFAPWVDPGFRDKAAPGELRWVVTDAEGNDEWVSGPDDVRVIGGKLVKPTSRTFIPAKLADNPYLIRTNYQDTLDALPEPFRSLLLGGFRTQFKDQDSQLIPSAWVKAAQARWKPDGGREYGMTAMGLDPAGGGDDPAALAPRHGPWYAPLIMLKGEQNRDGSAMAAQVVTHRRGACPIVVDVGGGYGTDVSSRLRENGITPVPFNGSNASTARAAEGLKFYNARAEAYWTFREELNPDRDGGSQIALPPDDELAADLTAPTFEVRTGGILVESKESIRKRLGRSTNKGDAVVMACGPGNKAVKRDIAGRRTPMVHSSYGTYRPGARPPRRPGGA